MARKRRASDSTGRVRTVGEAEAGPGNGAGTGSVRAAITRRFEIYGARSQLDLDFLRPLGFTQVILDDYRLVKPAESAGFGVVLANWWDRETTWEQVRRVLEFARGVRRLVSINMMDEPILNGAGSHEPAVYLGLREEIRRAGYDPRLSLTIYGPQPAWPTPWSLLFVDYLGAIDLLRIDPYPIAGRRPLREVAEWIEQAKRLMAAGGRGLPLTVVLQAWDSGDGLPSIAQIRVMAYMAMLSGAETLSFFEYNPSVWSQVPGFTEGFVALMGELGSLAREFEGAAICPVLGGDDLFQAEVELGGEWTCITVNTLGRPNGPFGPYQVVRDVGRCPRPRLETIPEESLRPHHRKRALPMGLGDGLAGRDGVSPLRSNS